MAPFGDPEWKIWGCSPGVYGTVGAIGGRVDEYFELHRWRPPTAGRPGSGDPWFSPEYCQYLRAHPKVWVADPVALGDIPNASLLPWQQLVAKYGPYFFTSSLSWMFAMALEAGAKTIGMWGVDMSACTSPETKVLTADLRWIRADEVTVGMELVGFDEEPQDGVGGAYGKRRWRKAKVLDTRQLVKPCYRLTLEDGRELVCSYDHKWLTHAENACKWRQADQLVTPQHRPDRPTRIVKVCDVWEEDRSWEAGYLAAAFDGEGHLTQKLREEDYAMLRIGFAQRDNPMSEMVLNVAKGMGFNLAQDSQDSGANGDVRKYSIRGGRPTTMEFLGRVRPRRLIEKFNPDMLGLLHKQDTVAVVKAEFIGDQPVIGFSTSTKTFVAEGLATHNTEEYGYQRAGCQFFVQLAATHGIEVIVPWESDLLVPPPLYGVCEIDHQWAKLLARKQELLNRLNEVTARDTATKGEYHFVMGALDDINYMMNTWTHNNAQVPLFGPPPVAQPAQPVSVDDVQMGEL